MSLKQLEKLLMRHRLMDKAGEGDQGGGGAGGEGGTGEEGGEGGAGEGTEGGEGGTGASGSSGDPGKPKPTDAEAKLLKEVMEKKRALAKATEKVTELSNKLKDFEGIDPVAIKAMLSEREAAEQKRLEAAGDWERLKKQMAEQHNKELKTKEEQISAFNNENAALKRQIAELTVGGAFSSSAYIRESLTMTPNKARLVYGPHFEFVEGKLVGYDKPAGEKERTMLVDGAGEALPFDQALAKIIDADPERDELIRSKAKSGAGSTTSPKAKPPTDPTPVTGTAKIADALSKGVLNKL